MTQTRTFTHDDACELGTDAEHTDSGPAHRCQCGVREVGWVAREALALMTEHVDTDSPRRAEFMARKRALLAYIEAAR